MPAPLPQIEPVKDADPIAAALSELLGQVRAVTEWVTNGDPSPGSFVDFPTYRQMQEWTKNPGYRDALDVIDGILQGRLKLSYPYNHKALIITQLIPEARLAPYAPLLEPLASPPPDDSPLYTPSTPFMATLATSLHSKAAAQAAQIKATKKSDEEQKKKDEEIKNWEMWCGLYGRSGASWYGLPHADNVKWGYYDWQPIGEEGWWKTKEGEKA